VIKRDEEVLLKDNRKIREKQKIKIVFVKGVICPVKIEEFDLQPYQPPYFSLGVSCAHQPLPFPQALDPHLKKQARYVSSAHNYSMKIINKRSITN